VPLSCSRRLQLLFNVVECAASRWHRRRRPHLHSAAPVWRSSACARAGPCPPLGRRAALAPLLLLDHHHCTRPFTPHDGPCLACRPGLGVCVKPRPTPRGAHAAAAAAHAASQRRPASRPCAFAAATAAVRSVLLALRRLPLPPRQASAHVARRRGAAPQARAPAARAAASPASDAGAAARAHAARAAASPA
jgi:hypothetical protein